MNLKNRKQAGNKMIYPTDEKTRQPVSIGVKRQGN